MYKIIPTEKFIEDIEYYESKKRFKHISEDVDSVVKDLTKGNLVGEEIKGLHINNDNNKIIKVRIANSDTRMGKSNGYRMIYYAIKNDEEVFLLSIYYKKEDKRVLSDQEIVDLVKYYCV